MKSWPCTLFLIGAALFHLSSPIDLPARAEEAMRHWDRMPSSDVAKHWSEIRLLILLYSWVSGGTYFTQFSTSLRLFTGKAWDSFIISAEKQTLPTIDLCACFSDMQMGNGEEGSVLCWQLFWHRVLLANHLQSPKWHKGDFSPFLTLCLEVLLFFG